jgi:threonine 3-dehydrogenase
MAAKMKAVMKLRRAPGFEMAQVPVPKPGPNDLLVKVKATSICGTDIHIYKWDQWSQNRIKPPIIIGHEFCGDVVQVGKNVKNFQEGDYVSAESHIPCGHCYQCRNEMQHICGNLKILGVDTDGCYADYAVIPAVVAWKNDRSMPPEVACVQEPLGNAVYAVLVEDVTGKSVAVFGCGPAGLFSVAVAKAAGASKIIHIIVNEFVRKISKKVGSDVIIRYDDPDLLKKVIRETGGIGVQVVMEMSGSQQAIDQGLQILTKGGRFTAFGIPAGPVHIDLSNGIIFKGARIVGINGRLMFGTWYRMAGLLNSGALDPTPVITHQFPLAKFDEAFKKVLPIDRKACKVVLVP